MSIVKDNCLVVLTARNKPRSDQLLLKVINNSDVMLDVGGVGVVGQADDVVIQHPEPGGEEVEVDELGWGPDHPLGQVQSPTNLDCLIHKLRSCLPF